MNGIFVFMTMLLSLVFYPAASQPNQPECPPVPYDLEEIRAIASRDCWFGQEQAQARGALPSTAASQVDPGSHLYLPSVQTGPAEQPAGSAAPDVERSIDQPPAQENYHTVQPGESLQKIGRLYDTSVSVLLLANPQIRNRDLIHIGDRVRIPSAEETERLRTEAEQRRVEYQRQVVANVPHKDERWIDVDLQSQTVRAYEGDTLVKTFVASTGRARTPTVTGQYRIWVKLRTDDMRGPGYDLKDVPYVMYFYKGYGLHGTYWHSNFGTPMSNGCVNLRTEDAAWLFDFSSVGTLVNVH